MSLPSEPADQESTSPEALSGEAIARRKLLQQAGWVLPAIVSTVTVSARAAQATCTPTCRPVPTGGPAPACNPSSCKPSATGCQPLLCKPRS